MIYRWVHRVVVSSVLATPLFAGSLLLSGCGGEGAKDLTPVDKQNISDEMKGAEEAKKNTEVRVRPSA